MALLFAATKTQFGLSPQTQGERKGRKNNPITDRFLFRSCHTSLTFTVYVFTQGCASSPAEYSQHSTHSVPCALACVSCGNWQKSKIFADSFGVKLQRAVTNLADADVFVQLFDSGAERC